MKRSERIVKEIKKYFDKSIDKELFYKFLIRYFQPAKKVTSKELADLDFDVLLSGTRKKLVSLAFQIMDSERYVVFGCKLMEAMFEVPRTNKETQQRKTLIVACVKVLEEMEQGDDREMVIADGYKENV